jgi:hypothetical protein
MKKIIKIVGIALGVLIGIAAVSAAYFTVKYPNVDPAPSITVERTPARIERGKYLANNVAVCMDCHSTRNWTLVSGPIVPGTEGKGGDKFDEAIGMPGTIYARNITPAAIGYWTDGELYRAITSGVSNDGRALFPLMPYEAYSKLSEDDLYSIIAYIRTLKPIHNEVPETKLNFPVNFLIRTAPKNHVPVATVAWNSSLERGKYLVNAAGCIDCHTQSVEGKPVEGMEFAGGMKVPFPQGTIRSSNITPDNETGIGLWSKQSFIARFKQYADTSAYRINVDVAQYYTIMPWSMYSGMTEDDLSAIFDYLQTQTPVKNHVEKFTPANQSGVVSK